MKKEMEKYISKEYQEICRSYSSKYQIDLKNLKQELLYKGQINSGISEQMQFDLIRKNITQMVEEFENLLNEAQKNFKRKIKDKEVKDYADECIKTVNQSLDIKQKNMIEDNSQNNKNISETIMLSFNNLRGNIESNIKDFSEKTILINTGKKVDTNITLTWIGIIIGGLGLIATIIFGILPFLK